MTMLIAYGRGPNFHLPEVHFYASSPAQTAIDPSTLTASFTLMSNNKRNIFFLGGVGGGVRLNLIHTEPLIGWDVFPVLSDWQTTTDLPSMTVTKRWDCPVASEVRMPYSRRISPWISRSLLAFCSGNQFSRPAQHALSQLTLHQFCTTRILSTHDKFCTTPSHNSHHTSSAQRASCQLMTSSAQHPVTTHITPVLHNAHPVNSWQVLHNTQSQLTSHQFCTVIIMDSFMCCISKLEHLAHYKGKNKTQSRQTSTSTGTHTSTNLTTALAEHPAVCSLMSFHCIYFLILFKWNQLFSFYWNMASLQPNSIITGW